MREATGQVGLMNIMLFIIGIIIVLLAGSIAYTKAFRVKNKIIDIIEKHNEYNDDSRNASTVFLSKSSFSINNSLMGKLFMASINANLTNCSPFWRGYCSS